MLQEVKPKKRKICPADENDSGIEVYYREEEEDDQEEEAAKKKSKVKSLEENLSLKWPSSPIDMCQFDFKTISITATDRSDTG